MKPPSPVHPAWGLLEIGALASLFVVGLWVIGPHVGHSPAALVAYWLFTACGTLVVLWLSPKVLHDDPPDLRGWSFRRPDSPQGTWRQTWGNYAAFTGVAALGLILWAAWKDPALERHIRWDAVALKFVGYLTFALIQGLIFFGFVQTRIRTMIPAPAGPHGLRLHQSAVAGLSATIFALAHAPNTTLMALVFAAGCCWSWMFYKRPNIVPLVVSHAILGTLLGRVVLLNMRIGPFYAEPHGYILRSAVPGLKALIGDRF